MCGREKKRECACEKERSPGTGVFEKIDFDIRSLVDRTSMCAKPEQGSTETVVQDLELKVLSEFSD